LRGLPDFTVNSSSGDFGLNLWFDNENLGDFFQWNGSGVMTSTDGDTYGLSPGSTDGTLSVDGDTLFYMINNGEDYSLSQLQAGDDSAVSPDTNVAVWIGVDVGSGGSNSATISSIEGL
jgi:pyruvate/2-oxoacid:ferredoxin oxidoreductase beta subunit